MREGDEEEKRRTFSYDGRVVSPEWEGGCRRLGGLRHEVREDGGGGW